MEAMANMLSIKSDLFRSADIDDLTKLDSLYRSVFQICDQDLNRTLITLTFGSVGVRTFPISVPYSGLTLHFYLPSVGDSLFEIKQQLLPKKLLRFSDEYGGDDSDKIAHFFGSAFLELNSVGLFDFASLFGYFVEYFEQYFKVQSKADPRDLLINEAGRAFGRAIENNPHALPSQFFLNVYDTLNSHNR